ncbi:MAG TPA: hypothetical protein DIW51_13640, partial [Rhodospirillaceae bacterium]|nr:hypothetical protein [Rhodospirillaceae bacterium]
MDETVPPNREGPGQRRHVVEQRLLPLKPHQTQRHGLGPVAVARLHGGGKGHQGTFVAGGRALPGLVEMHHAA